MFMFNFKYSCSACFEIQFPVFSTDGLQMCRLCRTLVLVLGQQPRKSFISVTPTAACRWYNSFHNNNINELDKSNEFKEQLLLLKWAPHTMYIMHGRTIAVFYCSVTLDTIVSDNSHFIYEPCMKGTVVSR